MTWQGGAVKGLLQTSSQETPTLAPTKAPKTSLKGWRTPGLAWDTISSLLTSQVFRLSRGASISGHQAPLPASPWLGPEECSVLLPPCLSLVGWLWGHESKRQTDKRKSLVLCMRPLGGWHVLSAFTHCVNPNLKPGQQDSYAPLTDAEAEWEVTCSRAHGRRGAKLAELPVVKD